MSALAWLEQEILQLQRLGLLRSSDAALREGLIDVSSNDYLGYAARDVSRETLGALRSGAGASRLVSGTFEQHEALEQELAQWLQQPAALSFSSGYVANLSTIATLVGPEDAVFSDRLNHASIVDGCRLSGAKILVYPHLDLATLGRLLLENTGFRRRLVVTESYFSMDGDGPALPQLAELCRHFGAMLMLDEAHALGVFGPEGAGLALEQGVRPDVLVGTLGKALGLQGAFVCGSLPLREWLWNRARGFVFSTAISPLLAALAVHAVQRSRTDSEGRQRLHQLCELLADRLKPAGLLANPRFGPIFPVILGSYDRVAAASHALSGAGFHVPAIRPPTVPEGTARLRVSLNAGLDVGTVERLAQELLRSCA